VLRDSERRNAERSERADLAENCDSNASSFCVFLSVQSALRGVVGAHETARSS